MDDVERSLGLRVIDANQAGNEEWAPADQVQQVLTITPTGLPTRPTPLLLSLHVSSRSFSASHGTLIRASLNEAATIVVTLDQDRPGRLVNHHCRVAAKHGPQCRALLRRWAHALTGAPGFNRLRLTRLAIPSGTHTGTITARSGKLHSAPLTFVVVIASRHR